MTNKVVFIVAAVILFILSALFLFGLGNVALATALGIAVVGAACYAASALVP